MEDELFEELMQSVREAGAIVRGEAQSSRVTTLSTPDVKSLRESLGLSQKEFSTALRVSDGTLRNWEQNRRQPTGPARALLTLVEKQPSVLKMLVPTPESTSELTPTIRTGSPTEFAAPARGNRNRLRPSKFDSICDSNVKMN